MSEVMLLNLESPGPQQMIFRHDDHLSFSHWNIIIPAGISYCLAVVCFWDTMTMYDVFPLYTSMCIRRVGSVCWMLLKHNYPTNPLPPLA